jgi:hypothetical protein
VHARDSVTADVSRNTGPDLVADRELELVGPEGDRHVRLSEAVAGRVRQRLLEDPVGRLVEGWREWAGRTANVERHVDADGAMAGDDRLERVKAERRFDRAVTEAPVRCAVLA